MKNTLNEFSIYWRVICLVIDCPYCGVRSTTKWQSQDDGKSSSFRVYKCDNCHELILFVVKGNKAVAQYPMRIPKLDKSIPDKVREDYTEAIKCFDVGANKASVVMCRRALQNSVIDKGAKKGRLVDQIDELYGSQIITKDIKDWAHEIRLTGNIGAHPDEDGLQDVTQEDADELIKFMEEYLNYVYIMPAKVAKKRAKKIKEKAENE